MSATTSPVADATRSAAIRQQRSVWAILLNWRIHMQPMLTAVNRMPQSQHASNDGRSTDEQQSALRCLDELQADLTRLLQQTATVANSTTEDEQVHDVDGSFASESKARHAVLDKWLRRTGAMDGTASGGGPVGSLLHRSAADQLRDAVADRTALRRRTQLKRGQYDIVGQTDTDSKRRRVGGPAMSAAGRQQWDDTMDGGSGLSSVESSRHYVELFDDLDFYQRLLHDAISAQQHSTTLTASTSASLSTARTSLKSAVDRRASKGRKLQYVPIAKLSNFMAPALFTQQEHDRDEAAVDQIVANLFGAAALKQRPTAIPTDGNT